MSAGGKGSDPRPFSVPRDVFEDNWDRIFGGSKSEPVEEPKRGQRVIKMEVKSVEVVRANGGSQSYFKGRLGNGSD